MRLNDYQVKNIKKSVYSIFGRNSLLYLFGSRIDDTKHGGDIDLLVVPVAGEKDTEFKKLKAISKIQLALGDQKIDLIVADPNSKNPPLIVREALKGLML